MRLAYKQPIRKLYEPPVDDGWIWGCIYAVIDAPGFLYWRLKMGLGMRPLGSEKE